MPEELGWICTLESVSYSITVFYKFSAFKVDKQSNGDGVAVWTSKDSCHMECGLVPIYGTLGPGRGEKSIFVTYFF